MEFKRAIDKAKTELRRVKRFEKLAEGIKDSKLFFRYVKINVGSKEKIGGPLKDDNSKAKKKYVVLSVTLPTPIFGPTLKFL